MKTLKQIFSTVLLAAFILVMSQMIYGRIVGLEEDRCWQELSTTAQSVAEEMETKFKDEIVKLHLIKEIMSEEYNVGSKNYITNIHIEKIQATTIFERIDVLFPNNVIVSNGTEKMIHETIDFQKVISKGEYLTERKTDFVTGKECVYYVLPALDENGDIFAVILGVVDTSALPDIFPSKIYNSQANVCIIDASDGNYIMDNWHTELGNAYTDGDRERVKGYEDIDFHASMKSRETGTIAFVSKTRSTPLYMYYMPLDIADWQLAIFATEEVLFESLHTVRNILIFAGVLEIIMLCIYSFFNVLMMRKLSKSAEMIKDQQDELHYISYHDMLTSMYNRNKYTIVCNSLKEQKLTNIGVAYIDMNGLKQINDTQSHEAGDRYIRGAADSILSVFGEDSYRIGGDEFVILVKDVEKESFESDIARVIENAEKAEVSISIGHRWTELCEDLNALIKEAETIMYKEKAIYYTTHDRRR